MSIVIVQKTLAHVLSAMCEQSERESGWRRDREGERVRQTEKQRDVFLFV